MTLRTSTPVPAARPGGWRLLVAPGLATLVALGILVTLGTWQLQRKAWKEDLIRQVESRSHGEPGAILPETTWGEWQASRDEFRRVRVTGRFQHADETPVYGLAPTEMRGAPVQGYYLMTPLRLVDGSLVFVNRGFVPTELRDPAARPGSQPGGEVSVTGLVRAPEARNAFTPADDPGRNTWFSRDPAAIARARSLPRAAPFYVEADATQNTGGWPRGGQSRLNLPNDHLQYALTWFGLALTLIGVFATFAVRTLKPRST